MMKRSTMLSWCLAGLLAAGCAGAPDPPPPPPAPPADPGPCDLLTPDEVRTVLGEAVLHGEASGFECTYTRPPTEVAMRYQAVKLRLEFGDVDPYVLLSNYQATLRNALGDYDPAPLSGVGDAAAWDGDTIAATVALTPTRSAFVSVQLREVDPALEQRYAQMLVEQGIANLKQRIASAAGR